MHYVIAHPVPFSMAFSIFSLCRSILVSHKADKYWNRVYIRTYVRVCRSKWRGYFTVSVNGIIEERSGCCWRKCFLFCYDHFIVLCYSESLAESVTSCTCISSFPSLPHHMSFLLLTPNHTPPPYFASLLQTPPPPMHSRKTSSWWIQSTTRLS